VWPGRTVFQGRCWGSGAPAPPVWVPAGVRTCWLAAVPAGEAPAGAVVPGGAEAADVAVPDAGAPGAAGVMSHDEV